MKEQHGDYTKCLTEDLDPFRKCKPANCEEKYFGKRNFFNQQRKICERTVTCDPTKNSEMIYDYTTNECLSFKQILTDKETQEMKSGNFSNWVAAENEEHDMSSTVCVL